MAMRACELLLLLLLPVLAAASLAATPPCRLDKVLVARGLLGSRAQAKVAIDGGLVRLNGVVLSKAAAMAEASKLRVMEPRLAVTAKLMIAKHRSLLHRLRLSKRLRLWLNQHLNRSSPQMHQGLVFLVKMGMIQFPSKSPVATTLVVGSDDREGQKRTPSAQQLDDRPGSSRVGRNDLVSFC